MLKAAFAAAAGGPRSSADLGGAEDDHGYGAHRRSGGRYLRDHSVSERALRTACGDIDKMAAATIKMVTDSVSAFVRKDTGAGGACNRLR